jgi:hypothetical protein
VQGTNITISPGTGVGDVTINATGGGGGGITDSNIASTLQYSGYFSSVKLGYNAGFTNQGVAGIAIGSNAGFLNQGSAAVGMGRAAGYSNQDSNSIALGYNAGYNFQSTSAIAFGLNAGSNRQGAYSIAIGNDAGSNFQDIYGIAIGYQAGSLNQSTGSIAIGYIAGTSNQKAAAVAVGAFSGKDNQGNYTTAIGPRSGESNQADYSVAIGYAAGANNQSISSIIINATDAELNTGNPGFYVNPLRNISTSQTNTVVYNTGTNEIGYASGLLANVVVSTFNNNDDMYIYEHDLGKYFLLTTSNTGVPTNSVYLPATAQNGWNCVIKNMQASSNYFSVITTEGSILPAGVTTTVVCDGTNYYAL